MDVLMEEGRKLAKKKQLYGEYLVRAYFRDMQQEIAADRCWANIDTLMGHNRAGKKAGKGALRLAETKGSKRR